MNSIVSVTTTCYCKYYVFLPKHSNHIFIGTITNFNFGQMIDDDGSYLNYYSYQ